jgi:hypothetical protein
MTALLTTLAGALIPAIPNWFKDILNSKQAKADRDFELEKIKAASEAEASKAACLASFEADKAAAESAARQAEANAKIAETNAGRAAMKTGIKWIDAGDAAIRLTLGVVACAALIWAMLQAWTMTLPIWEQSPIWEIVVLIISFFVGYLPAAYTCKKVYGGK